MLSIARLLLSQRDTAALETPSSRASSACDSFRRLRTLLNSLAFTLPLVTRFSRPVKLFLLDSMIGYHALPPTTE